MGKLETKVNEPIHIISLGAGVQSSTMALMAAHGEITPMPKCAIFADTQDEPQSVYTWLDWLEKQLPFPVLRVTEGKLSKVSTTPKISGKTGLAYLSASVPVFTLNLDGTKGMMRRQCTDKHKLTPLRKAALKYGKNIKMWIGISMDEVHRMKPSPDSRIENIWPLIDKRISRSKCLEWMFDNGYQEPPRSACDYCPYHSDNEWMRLRREEPQSFDNAIRYEKELQEAFVAAPRLDSIPFLHRSRVPLDQVDFSTDEDHGQQVMFGNECEGMCGV